MALEKQDVRGALLADPFRNRICNCGLCGTYTHTHCRPFMVGVAENQSRALLSPSVLLSHRYQHGGVVLIQCKVFPATNRVGPVSHLSQCHVQSLQPPRRQIALTGEPNANCTPGDAHRVDLNPKKGPIHRSEVTMETLENETSRRAAARRCHDARGRPQEAERSRTRCHDREWLSLGIVVAGHPVVQKYERCLTSCFCPPEKETI